MSNNYSSIFSRLVMSCCMVIAVTMLGTSPTFAQTGINGTEATTFPVEGVPSVRVNASGSRVGGFGDEACPFSDMDMNKLSAAFAAAKNGDPDSCPHAVSPILGRKIYFRRCAGVYAAVAQQVADAQHPEINVNIMCCHKRPGPDRDQCRNKAKAQKAAVNAYAGLLSKEVKVPPLASGAWSTEDAKKIREAKQAEADAEKQCFEDSFNRIEEYWAQKRGVSCIRYVSRAIKSFIKDGMRGLRSSMLEQTTTGGSSTMTYGALTAVASAPSIWGIAGSIAAAANFASDAISLASEASDMLSTLSDQCGNVIPALKQIQEWRKTVLGMNLCQAAENLLERQLTQCIRINLDASAALRLPQFSIMLQCPVNVNVNMRLTPRGFDCYARGSAGSPVRLGGTGRRSLLSGNGGLENLFNGKCFTSPTSRPESGVPNGGTGQGGIGDGSSGSTRTPGVDCGPLDPSPVKQAVIKGQQVLGQGRTTNGWAIGGSETVSGQRVTRCDFYDAGRHIRSTYVFGDGASCRSQEGGFMAGGYETNTACYAGYTPAAGRNIPDACMFEPGCLDANGNFDINRAGSSGCPTSVPQFNPNRVYNTFVQGGINGGGAGNLGRPCSDFADVDPNALNNVVCCDPQRQDCRERDANVALCACDEGDTFNRVRIDPLTNAPDALGRCEQGGKKTCCSPRLNGGKEACAMMGMEICESEVADQCVGTDSPVTYVGPDGVTRTDYTAAQMAQSKPSPYLYLFVRPDVTMPNGQQCCTTEWCNICPQHYANAYGLSLKRDSTYLMPQNDAQNRAIIGKGWPFELVAGEPEEDETTVNLDEDTQYAIGLQELPFYLNFRHKRWLPFEVRIQMQKVPLFMSDDMPQPASLATCNNLSPLKVGVLPADRFKKDGSFMPEYGMAYVFRKNFFGGVPLPKEMPLDYLNRLRRGVTDSEGTPLPPVTLCSDVKICTPESSGTVLQPTPPAGSGGGSGSPVIGSPTFSGPVRGGLVNTISPVALPSFGTISVQPGAQLTPTVPGTGINPGGVLTPAIPKTGVTPVPGTGAVLTPVAPVTGGAVGQPKMVAPATPKGVTVTPGPTAVPSATTQQGAGNAGTSSGKSIGLY